MFKPEIEAEGNSTHLSFSKPFFFVVFRA